MSKPASPAPGAGPPPAEELRAWADRLARQHFGTGFVGGVAWAPRLRYRAGDFSPATGRIRLSLPYYLRYGRAETERILLHELCHWWLFRQGQGHREDAPAFQALLARHGAPARGLPMPRAAGGQWRVYACPVCGARYRYRRRVDLACGPCCRRYAGGRYDPRFRLVPLRPA